MQFQVLFAQHAGPALINSQGVRCAVLLCLSSFPSPPNSILAVPGAQGWESTAWDGETKLHPGTQGEGCRMA